MSNTAIRAALIRDAVYQVLDNKVFRILLILTLVMVAIPLSIGFREDEVVVLWGFREYYYDDVLGIFGAFLNGIGATQQERAISGLQSVFVNGIAGSFGMLFCIAATSFFVPRLLEKGAADPPFSKPVSRFSLLLSRYIAAVAFIGILAVVLVGGIHIALLLNSHYSDPNFLWAAPRLIYVFAMLSAVSTLVGTWTRSNTSALLLTFVFYGICTGVHTGWVVKHFALASAEQYPELAELRDQFKNSGADPEVVDELGRVARFGSLTLDGLHYVLPKTKDAPRIEALLRDQLQEIAGQSGEGVRVEVGEDDTGARQFMSPFVWYDQRFGWSAPLPFNAWFSILSSLAFIAAALALAWAKLRRISF